MSYNAYIVGEDYTQYQAEIKSGATSQGTIDAGYKAALTNVTRFQYQSRKAAGDPAVTTAGSGTVSNQPPGYSAPYSGN